MLVRPRSLACCSPPSRSPRALRRPLEPRCHRDRAQPPSRRRPPSPPRSRAGEPRPSPSPASADRRRAARPPDRRRPRRRRRAGPATPLPRRRPTAVRRDRPVHRHVPQRRRHRRRREPPHGPRRIKADQSFSRAVRGFAAKLDEAAASAILGRPERRRRRPRRASSSCAQTIPTGVSRVGGRLSDVADIDGTDQRVDADVAIVDTGIAQAPDLNVAGGYNCSTATGRRGATGTTTARTWPARSAPSTTASASSVSRRVPACGRSRSSTTDGYGLISWYVCGLDWILAQRDPNDASPAAVRGRQHERHQGRRRRRQLRADQPRPRSTRRSAASSRAGSPSSPPPPTTATARPTASRRPTTRSSRSPRWPTPTASPAASAATAATRGAATTRTTRSPTSATTAATSTSSPRASASGPRCPGPAYAYMSGTSMAAPTVTGAVALYKASRPNATPAEVKRGAPLPGQPELEDLDRSGLDPRAAARRLADRAARDVRPDARRSSDTRRRGQHDAAGPDQGRPQSTFFERVRLSRHVAAGRLERRRSTRRA